MIDNNRQILFIKNIFHDIQSITMPVVSGFGRNVYIVKTADKKYVCKFSDIATAKRNLYVSKLFLANNINVPDISIHNSDDICCETYPFIEGKTFHERILEGMSQEEQDKVYNQIFDLMHKIATVQCDSKNMLSGKHLLAKIVIKAFDMMNPKEQKTLGHADLNTKNVILDSNDNICALIDLDSVYLCNFVFMFVSMVSCAKMSGYVPQKLIDNYIASNTKSLVPIKKQIQTYHFLRELYIKTLYKQMLNSKGK